MSDVGDIEKLAGLLRLAAQSVTLLEKRRPEGSGRLFRAAHHVFAAADLLEEESHAEPDLVRERRALQ